MDTIKNVELNKKEKAKIILENTIRMLIRRNKLKNTNFDTKVEKAISGLDDKMKTIIKSDQDESKIGIIFAPDGMSTIKKAVNFEDFLVKNESLYKVVIIKDINKKVLKQILQFQNTEVWWEDELLEDLISKTIIPKHIVLSEKEREIFLQNYKMKELSTIFSTDIMARYYKMKINDVVRIVRPSNTSGNSIFYRLVRQGPLDLMI